MLQMPFTFLQGEYIFLHFVHLPLWHQNRYTTSIRSLITHGSIKRPRISLIKSRTLSLVQTEQLQTEMVIARHIKIILHDICRYRMKHQLILLIPLQIQYRTWNVFIFLLHCVKFHILHWQICSR